MCSLFSHKVNVVCNIIYKVNKGLKQGRDISTTPELMNYYSPRSDLNKTIT